MESVFCGLVILLSVHAALCEIQHRRAVRDHNVSDTIFMEDLLFDVAVRSVAECGRQCSSSGDCVTFTATKTSSQWSCRGHSSLMTQGSPGMTAPSTRVFTFSDGDQSGNWVERPCTTDAECEAENSTCFHGLCLCIPGYYYSISLNHCVETCAAEDLQSTFMRYRDSSIFSHNMHLKDQSTEQECMELCVANAQCLTIEVLHNYGRCKLASVTALTINPNYWLPGTESGEDHYQRHCV